MNSALIATIYGSLITPNISHTPGVVRCPVQPLLCPKATESATTGLRMCGQRCARISHCGRQSGLCRVEQQPGLLTAEEALDSLSSPEQSGWVSWDPMGTYKGGRPMSAAELVRRWWSGTWLAWCTGCLCDACTHKEVAEGHSRHSVMAASYVSWAALQPCLCMRPVRSRMQGPALLPIHRSLFQFSVGNTKLKKALGFGFEVARDSCKWQTRCEPPGVMQRAGDRTGGFLPPTTSLAQKKMEVAQTCCRTLRYVASW